MLLLPSLLLSLVNLLGNVNVMIASACALLRPKLCLALRVGTRSLAVTSRIFQILTFLLQPLHQPDVALAIKSDYPLWDPAYYPLEDPTYNPLGDPTQLNTTASTTQKCVPTVKYARPLWESCIASYTFLPWWYHYLSGWCYDSL